MTQFTLPDHEEMLKRLLKIDIGEHAIREFYPRVLDTFAGSTEFPEGFLMMWTLLVSDYAQGMPPVAAVMSVATPRYVSALIDDDQARSEVMALLKLVGLPTGADDFSEE